MNILIIPSWYPSKSNPHIGSFFREQAIALQRAGHHVIILNATYQRKSSYFDSDNFKLKILNDEGVKVYSYVTPSFGIVRAKRLMCWNFFRRIRRIYHRIIADGEKINIIHAHSFMPAGYGAYKLGKVYDIPVVVTEHSSGVINKNISPFEINLLKKCVDGTASFICVGEGLKKRVIELTKTNKMIHVIPNMVSPLFKYKEKSKQAKNFLFLAVGNLTARKRFGMTIDAFIEAFKGNENVKLKIVGGGPLYDELKNQIDKSNMSKQITLLGALSREETAQQMQDCDAFILVSAYETFGVVYIEAMACGKPVIGTRNGGADWIINKNNGILIDVDNKEQLVQAMKRMITRYKNYRKEDISKETISQYSEISVVKKLNGIYERCIQE
ncbi:Glycogen synthase [Pelotomaculum schinkii]|uniref:Glycogen synthase n=1 Tax=Pelotomaculum schinkii TaxID=78350 RepID=A0A4Y7RHB5_9FIRM|nr:glycosyltransferase [Pelotomaculum schinkii]TEB08216.1 Glycogen synthase [Pelotomaculum schinkii]